MTRWHSRGRPVTTESRSRHSNEKLSARRCCGFIPRGFCGFICPLGAFRRRFWFQYVCPSGAIFSLGNLFGLEIVLNFPILSSGGMRQALRKVETEIERETR